MHFLLGQSTLQFSFTPPASTYFQEENLANITCSVSTSATLSSGGFPLSWSRNSGDLPDGSTVKDSRQGSGVRVGRETRGKMYGFIYLSACLTICSPV